MRQYKDSGIEWIGKIPETWEVCQLKRLLSFNNGQDYKQIESDSGYPVYGSGGVFMHASQYLYDGEAVLFGRKGTINKPLYVNDKFWTVDTMYYAIPKEDSVAKYLYYMAILFPYDKYQTSTALPSMTQSVLGNLIICVPQKNVQQRIADYLDSKCGEIDSLIGLQEQMIEKLKAYKQSVITEAVTKGLDPNVKLVPSGIDWIGEIPEGWTKDKVIRCFHKIGSGTTPKSTDNNLFQGNINWLQSGDINGGNLYEASKHISEQTLASYSALSVYQAPFIIIAMYGASVGNISMSHVDACVNQACCVLSGSNLNFNYAFYALKSAKPYLIYRAEGGGQPNISQDKLKTLWIPRPPMDEQHSIAAYLDSKCADTDRLIALKQQKIESLKEYKKSVIYEAVTGKTIIE